MVPGAEGLGGPYKDIGFVLQPEEGEQPWEGLQGDDSIFPFLATGNKLMGFYGSATLDKAPIRWLVGLATAPYVGGKWERMSTGNPVNWTDFHTENPIVSYLPVHDIYVAVFDYLSQESTSFGFVYSYDGILWPRFAQAVEVPGGARTPLALIPIDETETKFYIFYTVKEHSLNDFECVWAAQVYMKFE